MTRKTGTLREDQYTFMIISRSVIFRMRNVPGKFVQKIKTLISFPIIFFKYRAAYEIMWKNIVQQRRAQIYIYIYRVFHDFRA